MKTLAFLAFALVTGIAPAVATDFTSPLVDGDGVAYVKCFKNDPATVGTAAPKCIDERPLTIGQAIYDALDLPDTGLTNDGIVSRGLLAAKIRTAKDLELDAGQRDVVKAALFAAVNKLGYRPTSVVQVLKLIDPAAVKER